MTDAEDILAAAKRFMVRWHEEEKEEEEEEKEKEEEAEEAEKRVGSATYPSWVAVKGNEGRGGCLLYTSPSPRDRQKSRMPSSA